MFGLRLRTHEKALLASALLVGVAAGCSVEKLPNELGLRVGFACASDRAQSDLLQLRVTAGGCDAGGESVYEATLGRGEQAPPAAEIRPGRYAIEATAFEREAKVAHACIETTLPSSRALEIELRSATCKGGAGDAQVSMDAEADAEADGGEPELDGETDLDADPEPDDADAAAAECTSDCADTDPCTEDLCVDGTCTNPAYTGARECDGIACTQGDMCLAGVCQPGAANHAACPDDGNLCSAETCVPGAGCNRSNAGADGRACNDNIGCTDADTCSNGICRGTDNCADGVCSAAKGFCLSCTNAQDCDDGNPCTTDACGVDGQCSHNNNSASCSDGKSCTGNDVCSAGRCAGVSTCASDATCGGSTCSCNDGNETLCGNSCVNLQNATSDCGLCGRACGSGSSCESGACKPGGATACTAFRNGGHDYLVCTDARSWTSARDRCRSFGLVLAVIENQAENDLLRDRLGGGPRWIGANDRGLTGNNCRLSGDEGSWFWASSTSDKGLLFCTAATSGAVACRSVSSRFQNFNGGEPNNGCTFCTSGCGEGQDCASMDIDGTWDDDVCIGSLGYICETP